MLLCDYTRTLNLGDILVIGSGAVEWVDWLAQIVVRKFSFYEFLGK